MMIEREMLLFLSFDVVKCGPLDLVAISRRRGANKISPPKSYDHSAAKDARSQAASHKAPSLSPALVRACGSSTNPIRPLSTELGHPPFVLPALPSFVRRPATLAVP